MHGPLLRPRQKYIDTAALDIFVSHLSYAQPNPCSTTLSTIECAIGLDLALHFEANKPTHILPKLFTPLQFPHFHSIPAPLFHPCSFSQRAHIFLISASLFNPCSIFSPCSFIQPPQIKILLTNSSRRFKPFHTIVSWMTLSLSTTGPLLSHSTVWPDVGFVLASHIPKLPTIVTR